MGASSSMPGWLRWESRNPQKQPATPDPHEAKAARARNQQTLLLLHAIERNNLAGVQTAIQNSAVVDHNHQQPLKRALFLEHENIVMALVLHGADPWGLPVTFALRAAVEVALRDREAQDMVSGG